MAGTQGSKPLTNKTVESMKPRDKDKADIGEYRGLRVSCGAGGTKSFFYRYTSPETGKLTQMKIGTFPSISLAEARGVLLELKQLRRSGVCPASEARRSKQEADAADEQNDKSAQFTVERIIELYLSDYIEDRKDSKGRIIPGSRNSKGQAEVRRTLYGDPVPCLGSKLARDVTRKDVVELILDIVGRGANVQAGNVLRELSAAYEFSIGLGKFSDDFANPALLAKASLRQARIRLTSQKGRRVLTENELAKLLNWLPTSTYTPVQRHIIQFTLWTGCRSGEVCNAYWKDIDLDKGTFHIRESKTGTERYVQLPRQAVDFLRVWRLATGECLFPSQKTRKPIQQKQLTEQAWRMRQAKTMLDIESWTPHDLRRTVRTGLSRLRCPNEVAEAVLGHARSGIEGTYDLHRYEDECREWLQIWADYLDNLSNSDH